MSNQDKVAEVVARLHLPDPELEATRPFFEAAAQGELRIPRCARCRHWVWYPQAVCPACFGRSIQWQQVEGGGRIFTWVRVHRSFLPGLVERTPYVTALIELDEEPSLRVPTILDCGGAEPVIGAPVEVTFEAVSEAPPIVVPRFRMIRPRT